MHLYFNSFIKFSLDFPTQDHRWGLLKLCLPLWKISIFKKYIFDTLNHAHICPVSPQLNCGHACQIRMWYSISTQCFHTTEKWWNERNWKNVFGNPHPRNWQKSSLVYINKYKYQPVTLLPDLHMLFEYLILIVYECLIELFFTYTYILRSLSKYFSYTYKVRFCCNPANLLHNLCASCGASFHLFCEFEELFTIKPLI